MILVMAIGVGVEDGEDEVGDGLLSGSGFGEEAAGRAAIAAARRYERRMMQNVSEFRSCWGMSRFEPGNERVCAVQQQEAI